jgi:putative spermidine/putrescine transport system ATP-binding protein
VRLPGYGARRPTQLSGGQQQRVAVARALVFEPKIVLMDEPLGALDKKLREEMQYEIKHIHDSLGVTVVYVTHDQGEALTMSNRIAVFNDGRIQQLDSPTELYEHPKNSFVAQFIGENNRLAGKVAAIDGGRCEVEIDGGGRVRALAVNVAGQGARTTISLRPERCALVLDGKSSNGANGSPPENVFEGRIEELIYLGDHVRARLSVCGRDDFVIKVPNIRGTLDLCPGVPARVAWRADDCRALDPT